MGYTENDYTLIDVVWAYDGTATTPATYANLYYAGVEHVSNNWNILGAAYVAGDMVTPLVSSSWTGAASASYAQVPLKFNGAIKRSPGIPLPLSNTALLRVHTSLASRNSAEASFALTQDNVGGVTPIPWGVQPAFTASVMLSSALNEVYQRQISNVAATLLYQEQIDTVVYSYMSSLIDSDGGGVVVRTFATAGGDASGSYQVALLGFVWDRLATYPQCLHPTLRN
jgi:hypothetical protein